MGKKEHVYHRSQPGEVFTESTREEWKGGKNYHNFSIYKNELSFSVTIVEHAVKGWNNSTVNNKLMKLTNLIIDYSQLEKTFILKQAYSVEKIL